LKRISGPVEVLTGVFSNAAPTIGSISDHHVGATIAQAPAWWQVFDAVIPKLNAEIWSSMPHSSKHRGTADAWS